MTRVILAFVFLLVLTLPACIHPRHTNVTDVATQVVDPAFEGNWKTANDRVFTIKRAGSDHYTVKPSDSDTTYDADLLDINSARFVEFTVHEQRGSKDVPVYMYGRITIKGNDLTFRRLRNEWLEKAAKGMDGVTYKSTADIQRNSGGAIVNNPTTMHDLLSKAAQDPGAFGDPETARRGK